MPEAPPFRDVCVFGAGALGGAIAASLAAADLPGLRVSVVARGEQLAAIRRSGLRLIRDGREVVGRVAASGDPAALGPQDLVITALKGHQFPAAAEGLAALLAPRTRVVTVLNGIPWWFGDADPAGPDCAEAREMLDPGGVLRSAVGVRRVIGCVAHCGAEVVAPGEVSATREGRFILGEPAGAASADVHAAAALLAAGGWRSEVSERIRDDMWDKLMGNASFNPVSALARATLSDIANDPALLVVVGRAMAEVRDVAVAFGAKDLIAVDARIAMARRLGPIRSSMLQDLERGRAPETVPLLGAVAALGRAAGVGTPTLDALQALVDALDRNSRTA